MTSCTAISRVGASASALALLATLAAPAQAAPPEHHTPVELEVDTSDLEQSRAERLGAKLREALEADLRESGFEVVHDGADARIEARIWKPEVEVVLYAIDFEVIVKGQQERSEHVECEACNEGQVVDQVLGALPGAMEVIPLLPPPPPPPPPCVPLGSKPQGELKLGPVGFSGALTIVGGAATLGAGVVFATLAQLPPDEFEAANRQTRQRGFAMVGLGSVFVLGGVAAVLVDMKVLRPRQAKRNVDVAADVSQTRFGVSVSGRF